MQVAARGAGAAQGRHGPGGRRRERARQARSCDLEQRLGGRAHDVHAARRQQCGDAHVARVAQAACWVLGCVHATRRPAVQSRACSACAPGTLPSVELNPRCAAPARAVCMALCGTRKWVRWLLRSVTGAPEHSAALDTAVDAVAGRANTWRQCRAVLAMLPKRQELVCKKWVCAHMVEVWTVCS